MLAEAKISWGTATKGKMVHSVRDTTAIHVKQLVKVRKCSVVPDFAIVSVVAEVNGKENTSEMSLNQWLKLCAGAENQGTWQRFIHQFVVASQGSWLVIICERYDEGSPQRGQH